MNTENHIRGVTKKVEENENQVGELLRTKQKRRHSLFRDCEVRET